MNFEAAVVDHLGSVFRQKVIEEDMREKVRSSVVFGHLIRSMVENKFRIRCLCAFLFCDPTKSDEAIEDVFLSLFCGFKVEQGTVFSGTGQNPGQKCGFRKRQIFRFLPEKGMCRRIDAPCSVTEIYSIEIFLENGIL